jgi:hypothetical protein
MLIPGATLTEKFELFGSPNRGVNRNRKSKMIVIVIILMYDPPGPASSHLRGTHERMDILQVECDPSPNDPGDTPC